MAQVRMHAPPARTVKRPNQRWGRQRPITRGGAHDHAAADPATGATAGIPGTWTPAGSYPPASPTALAQGDPVTVVASPATAWTTGQYVQTRTAGAAGRATWSGSAWVGGAAPLAEVDLERIGEFTIAVIQYWVDQQHPELADEALAAEQARGDDARVTLIDWLEGFIAHRDEP